MIYFIKNNDVIEKYQIDFNKKEIEKLRDAIIDNCSYIEHKEYYCDHVPRLTNKIVRNYKFELTNNYVDYFVETRETVFVSYDEYNAPELVNLINRLLENDSRVLQQIFNYDISTNIPIDDKIDSINKEFFEIDIKDIEKKKAKLYELEKLLKIQELNKNQQGIKQYYNQLIELIKIKLIDSISVSELERMESFLETYLSNKIENNYSNEKPFAIVKSLKKLD